MSGFFKHFDWKDYQLQFPDCTNEYKARIHFAKANRFPIRILRLPHNELKIQNPVLTVTKLPGSVDLRSKFPPCYDQGQLGSCTANAFVGAYQYLKPSFMGSRLFLYYNERVIEGSVRYDAGAYIHDGVKSLKQTGLCPETDWLYDISKFAVKPPTIAYTDALSHKVLTAYSVTQTLEGMKTLLSNGIPFVIGILCYGSFLTSSISKTGLVPIPPVNKSDKVQGGHAVLVVGFSDTVQCPGGPSGSFLCRNSWGTSWGLNGYFWLPYNYLTSKTLCSDNWYLSTVSG